MRRANAAALDEALLPLGAVSILVPPNHLSHAYYKYCGLLDLAALKSDWSHDRVCAELNAKGVPARVGACPEGISGSEWIRQTERAPAFPTEVWALFIFGTKRDKT